MSNITVKRENGNRPATLATPAQADFEPSRWISRMLGWDPFREMAPFPSIDERVYAFAPAFEVKETKEAYVFKADTPGLVEKDIDVTLQGNRLTISGKREEEKRDQTDSYYTYERTYGSFSRSFTLPEGIEGGNVAADLKNGVLTIIVPKKPEVQAKKIEVNVGQKKS